MREIDSGFFRLWEVGNEGSWIIKTMVISFPVRLSVQALLTLKNIFPESHVVLAI